MPSKLATIISVLILFCLLFTPVSGQENTRILWQHVNEGKWTKLYLKNSLFPHNSRRNTYSYKNLVFTREANYSDSSAIIFVPKNYQTSQRGYNDVIVHFHGWNSEAQNVMQDFDLPGQLYRSQKNAILIIAQGPKNAMDSSGGKVEERNGLKKYIREILGTLKQDKTIPQSWLRRVIISAHNGGYRPAILGLVNGGLSKNIKEVFLFDSFYDLTEKIVPWLKSDADNRLRSIYTEDLVHKHQDFVKLITQNGLTYNKIVSKKIKVILRFSSACHSCVMDENFEAFLKISSLTDIEDN